MKAPTLAGWLLIFSSAVAFGQSYDIYLHNGNQRRGLWGPNGASMLQEFDRERAAEKKPEEDKQKAADAEAARLREIERQAALQRQAQAEEDAARLREIERQAELQKQAQIEAEDRAEKRRQEIASKGADAVKAQQQAITAQQQAIAAQQQTIEELRKQLEQSKVAPKPSSSGKGSAIAPSPTP